MPAVSDAQLAKELHLLPVATCGCFSIHRPSGIDALEVYFMGQQSCWAG
jgi:hypothetical protein